MSGMIQRVGTNVLFCTKTAKVSINVESILRYRIVPRLFFISRPYRVELDYDFSSVTIADLGGVGLFKTVGVNCDSYDQALNLYSDLCGTIKDGRNQQIEEYDKKIATLKEKKRAQEEERKILAEE